MSQLITFFTLESFAGFISLAGTLVVAAVVIFLITTSDQREDTETVKNKVFKIRGRYFWSLCIILLLTLFVTLQLLPYPGFQDEPDELVTVVGIQWDWELAHGISDKTPKDFIGKNEITLPVNKKIKFIVTSGDVNHGFGIYNNKGVLLTQVQAMPQYENDLQYVFTQKGNYSVYCLEYCGLVHPFMMATIHVQ